MVDFAINREVQRTFERADAIEARRPVIEAEPLDAVERLAPPMDIQGPTQLALPSPQPTQRLLVASMGERAPAAFRLRPDVESLSRAHRAERLPIVGAQQHFVGVGDKTVYNISAPRMVDGRLILLGRVESPHLETDSEAVPFERVGPNTWAPAKGLFRGLFLQDPFMTVVDGAHIVGGVQVKEKTNPDGSHAGLEWKTVFYRSTDGLKTFETDSAGKLKPVVEGPVGMKDIRIEQLRDGRIAFVSRPQGQLAIDLGAPGGLGSVGFGIVPSLRHLTAKVIEKAPLLDVQFPAHQWWGINRIKELSDGTLGLLGHAAMRFPAPPDGGDPRKYDAIELRLNPKTGRVSDMRTLIERVDLGPLGKSKREELREVFFSGDIDEHGVVWGGAGDHEAWAAAAKTRIFKVR